MLTCMIYSCVQGFIINSDMICELPGINIAHIHICLYAPTDNVNSDLICQLLDSHIVQIDLLYRCVMTDDVLSDPIRGIPKSYFCVT